MAMQKELIKNAFAKIATVLYPFEKVAPPEGLRGKHEYEQRNASGAASARGCVPVLQSRWREGLARR